MSGKLLKKIESRGYWTVTIRPTEFVEKRVPRIGQLEEILRQSRVSRRGWDFPHLRHGTVPRGLDGISLETDFEHILEVWSFAQSGQFVHVSGLMDDWRDQSSWNGGPKWARGEQLGILGVLARYQEIFQLASALSASPAGGPEMVIESEIVGLAGRMLVVDSPRRMPFIGSQYKAAIQRFPIRRQIKTLELQTNHRQLALDVAQELFERFTWDVGGEGLSSLADEALPRKGGTAT